ncbi:MAG: hypothetical protein SF339_29250 [Blastocatellia bacterium]|nr:hypothetical protein [Blastocatellia bacterium]
MPDNQTQITNSQTLVINVEDFSFEALEQQNGRATVLKFKLENPSVIPGDVLLILAGEEIQFHGLIGRVEDGWATASDRNGSQLPAGVH